MPLSVSHNNIVPVHHYHRSSSSQYYSIGGRDGRVPPWFFFKMCFRRKKHSSRVCASLAGVSWILKNNPGDNYDVQYNHIILPYTVGSAKMNVNVRIIVWNIIVVYWYEGWYSCHTRWDHDGKHEYIVCVIFPLIINIVTVPGLDYLSRVTDDTRCIFTFIFSK